MIPTSSVSNGFAWRDVGILLFGVLFGASTTAQIPSGPDRPSTGDECVAAFAPHFASHYRLARTGCKHCSQLDKYGREWRQYLDCTKQCSSVASDRHANLLNAREACFDRVKRVKSEHDQMFADGMNLGRRVHENLIDAYTAVTSPERFAQEKLGRSDDLYNGIFRNRSESDRKTLEWEVFRYSVVQAHAGIDAAEALRGRSTIIGSIQKGTLNRITSVYGNALQELEASFELVNSWHSMQINSYRSTGRAFSATGNSQYRQLLNRDGRSEHNQLMPKSGVDCTILDNTATSDALMQRDQSRWLALVSECRR